MREYLFRGKTFSGEWVEGVPMVWDGSARILTPPSIVGRLDCVDSFHVIPETVGEWTGLTDDSPKEVKIFEGDIIKTETCLFEVVFSYGVFVLSTPGEDFSVKFHEPEFVYKIGNVHDNPELLSGNSKTKDNELTCVGSNEK